MDYLKFIFEDANIQSLTESKEVAITHLVNETVAPFAMTNFKYVVENMDKFINSNLVESFDNIKAFAKNDMVALLSAVSEIAALDESFDHVDAIMQENVSNVFTGVGYGMQKAQRLISSTYGG